MRVLIGIEEEYRSYGRTIASTIEMLRARLDVSVVGSGEFEWELARLRPQVVISGISGRAEPGETLAWIDLELGLDRPASIWLDGRWRQQADPGLEYLLAVVDKAQRLHDRPRSTEVQRPLLPGAYKTTKPPIP